MSIVKEFKEFAIKGNVVDMGIGIIIGAAFGKIVSSFVADVITPPLGLLLGGVDFKNLKLTIKESVEGAPAVALNYGVFLQTIVDFTIIAFAMFLVIKGMNVLKKQAAEETAVPVEPPQTEKLLIEIRDLLKR